MKKSLKKTDSRFPFMNRFLTGLVIALALTLTAFEWTTVKTHPIVDWDYALNTDDPDDEIMRAVSIREKKERPKPKTTEIKLVDELPEPTPDPKPDPDPTPAPEPINPEPIDIDLTGLGADVDDNFDDDIAHESVEVFAHYDDCSHLYGAELMECSRLEISKKVTDNFSVSDQLKDIGGRQGALMFFIVDKEGNIHSIKALQSTSKAVVKDAIKAIKKLPKMNPAQQQGRNVSLQMTIPIIVRIN